MSNEGDVEMNTAPVEQATKRKLVDFAKNDAVDPKRPRAPADKTHKTNIIILILHLHEYLRILYKINPNHLENVALTTSILLNIHTHLRQKVNGQGSMMARYTDENATFDLGENKQKCRAVIETYVKICAQYGVVYNRTPESRKNVGTLTTLLTLFAAFKDRYSEVRVNTAYRTVGKRDHELLQNSISEYGLDQTHQVALKGLTYTPSKQSAMKSSLGPLTIAIILNSTTDDAFKMSWKQAFCNAFKLIPGHQEVAELLAKATAPEKTLLKHLGDISLFGVTRQSNKAHFPAAFLMTIARQVGVYKELMKHKTETNIANSSFGVDIISPFIENIDFAGHGALGFWMAAACETYTSKGGADFTADIASEMLFHATWGTHSEDFGYLEWLTGHRFKIRREIGDGLKKKGTGTTERQCTIIGFKRFAKLASAAQSKLLQGGKGQISEMPVFSGNRRKEIDLNGDLMKILEGKTTTLRDSGGSTWEQVVRTLESVKRDFAKKIREDGYVLLGTTTHYEPDQSKKGAEYGKEVTAVPVCSGRYFYSDN